MKPFMRVVLDEMPKDPDPIAPGEQATVAGYDDAGHLLVSWDNGRGLNLIPGVDKFHVVETEEELDRSFEWLYKLQGELPDGESSKCPRCGNRLMPEVEFAAGHPFTYRYRRSAKNAYKSRLPRV